MGNTQEEWGKISTANRIFACKSHKKALERQLNKVEFEYNRILMKRSAAYRKLMKYALPTIGITMISAAFLVFAVMLIVIITKSENGASQGEGLGLLVDLLVAVFGGFACAWFWIRDVRLIKYIRELNEQQIQCEMKISSLKLKLEDCMKELEELEDLSESREELPEGM